MTNIIENLNLESIKKVIKKNIIRLNTELKQKPKPSNNPFLQKVMQMNESDKIRFFTNNELRNII